MRPIHLKIAGLHSFRERQEIDFAELCQGGVFGIFGPTGSGKSSILDAMTLALYGKVERASNNTTGIMNHAEDRLSVSFTFELGNGQGRKRYVVERSYKRSDEVRLRSVSSRFVEITETNETVLADKDREVTAKVEEILGLTSDDFTRAVVLPQGKFAEFITLGGSDRRRMLQRLFHLEKYGDRLTARLKERKEEVEKKEGELRAKQSELGDGSIEQVQLAEERVKSAIEMVEQKRKHLLDAEKVWNETNELWQKQREKLEIENKLSDLRQQEASYHALELRLERAKHAERLQPYVEELNRSEQEQLHWQTQMEESAKQLQQAHRKLTNDQHAYRQAREERSSNEPTYIVQLEALKTAKTIQQQVVQLELEMAKQLAGRDRLQQEHHVKSTELQQILQQLEKGKQLQAKLKAELEQKMIKADTRLRLTQAMQQKQRFDHLQKEKQAIELERTKKEEQLSVLKQQETVLQKTSADLHAKLTLDVDALVQLDQDLDMLYSDCATLEQRVTEERKQQKENVAKLEKHLLALRLAEQLQEGEACPVCGSLEHPHVARGDAQLEDVNTDLSQLDVVLHGITEKVQEIKQLKFQVNQLSKRLETLPTIEQGIRTDIAVSSDADFYTARTDGLKTSRVTSHVQFQEIYVQISEKLERLMERFQHVAHSIDRGMKEIIAIDQQLREWQFRISHSEQSIADCTEKEKQLITQLVELTAMWDQNYPDISIDDIETTYEQMNRFIQEAETLQARINKGVAFIEEQEGCFRSQEEIVRQLHIEIVKVETELNAKAKTLHEHREHIEQRTNGKDIEMLLTYTMHLLEQLKQREEQAQIAVEQSEQQVRQYEGMFKAAEQSLANAKKRLLHANVKWEEQMQKSPFSLRDEVLSAIFSAEEQASVQAEITQYRDTVKALKAALLALRDVIGDKVLTESEWKMSHEAVEIARRELDTVLEDKAKAERDVEQLTEKYTRWQQIEQERVIVAEQLERYVKLQSVFRGNAFVDFIAEEQLIQISRDASTRLRNLTRGRYSIEVDSNGGFVISDDANGGVKRPVTTLSGGETFLTSLALALSLSAQVQLRGQYPLEFFFLDEGFGTLDQELLDTVVTALEKLQSDSLTVGVISHVPELKERIARKLIVEPAENSGRGTRVKLEIS